MDKAEILQKAQSDGCDEYETHVIISSNRIGTISLIVLCALAAVVELLRGNGIYEFFAIISGYEFAAIVYQFAKFKKRTLLLAAILSGVSFAAFTVLYIVFS